MCEDITIRIWIEWCLTTYSGCVAEIICIIQSLLNSVSGIHTGTEVPTDSDYLSLSGYLSIFSIYITDICQTSESFAKSVNLK